MDKKPIFLALEPANFEPEVFGLVKNRYSYVEFSPEFINFDGVEAIYVRFSRALDKTFLDLFHNCKFILCNATGIEHIDEQTCLERGISIISLRGETQFLETISATAEFTWLLVLALARRALEAALAVRMGTWDRNSFVGTQLRGRTLGIVGLGRNGRKLVNFAKAFEMYILVYDPNVAEYHGVEMCDSLSALCSLSDVVCITVISNDSTRYLFNAEVLSKIRPHALLVNSSRGEIVDEEFLLMLLQSRKIGGYATDVLANEQQITQNPLLRAVGYTDNLLITPHIGGVTHDSWKQTERFVVEKLINLTALS